MSRSIGVSITAIAAYAFAIVSAALANPMSADNFARNIWPTVNFLDQSSRLALKKSRSEKIRSFARSEASEQTAIANALVAWTNSEVSRQEPPKAAPIRVANPGSLMAAPFRAASKVSAGVADALEGVETGRSVAIDSTSARRDIDLGEIRLPNLDRNLQQLSALSGSKFDDLYQASQNDALLQLATVYAAYIQEGSDASLKALATRALPSINNRLSMIKALR